MRRLIAYILFIIIGLIVMTATVFASFQTVTVLYFDWEAGHLTVMREAMTVASNEIILQIRDAEGTLWSEQRQTVPDCTFSPNLPQGTCGSKVTFTTTLPYRGYWEKWAQGQWTLSNGAIYTYTVPAYPSSKLDSNGFTLIEVLEWHSQCPVDPPIPTLLPTLTKIPIQPTYTLVPLPTCHPTATLPLPQPTYIPEETPTPYPTYTPWPTQLPLRP